MATATTPMAKIEHALTRGATAAPSTATRETARAPATSPALELHPLDAYAAAVAESKNNQDAHDDEHGERDWMASSRMRCKATAAYAAHVAALVEEERDAVVTEAARMCSRFQKMRHATARMASAINTIAEDNDLSDQLQVDVARERCLDLQDLLRRLAESATFLSATAVPQAVVLGKELVRASQWMSEAEARAATMASELAARDREVTALREELRITQQTPTNSTKMNEGSLKLTTSNVDADTESESDEELLSLATKDYEEMCKSDIEDHTGVIDYKRECEILHTQLERQGETHKLTMSAAIQRLIALQEQLAESRLMLKEASNVNTRAHGNIKDDGKIEASAATSVQDGALAHRFKTALKSPIGTKPKRSAIPTPKIKVPPSVYSRNRTNLVVQGTGVLTGVTEPVRKTANTMVNTTTKRNTKPVGAVTGSGAAMRAVTTAARASGRTRAATPPLRAWRM